MSLSLKNSIKRTEIMKYYELMVANPHLFSNKDAKLKLITDPFEIQAWQTKKQAELKKAGLPLEWADIGVILEDPYTIFLRDLVEFPNGERRGYLRSINQADLRGGQGVAVLPMLVDKIILLHQYRHATRGWHLEIPRGYGETDTTAEENAKKELEEEMGAQVESLEDLGIYHINTGIDAGVVRLFLAHLSRVGQPEDSEGIEGFKVLTLDEFEKMISNAEITDGFTLGAWAKAKLQGKI